MSNHNKNIWHKMRPLRFHRPSGDLCESALRLCYPSGVSSFLLLPVVSPLLGLNHRLGLCNPSGIRNGQKKSFAEVSSGTRFAYATYPALKRRATIRRPSGTSCRRDYVEP